MLRFIDAKTDIPKFLEMYHEYVQTLTQYSDYLASHPLSNEYIITNYINEDLLNCYFIQCHEKNIGFIVLQYVDEKYGVNPPMWYIVEFYIAPECRGRGYGTKVVEHFLHKCAGGFFYYVLRKNLPAKRFWNAITIQFDLCEVERPDISCGDTIELEVHCFERGD